MSRSHYNYHNSFHIVFINLLLSLSLLVTCISHAKSTVNNDSNLLAFKKAFTEHQQLISENKYQEALPLAQKSYEFAKGLFPPLDSKRLSVTDNFALNLQVTNHFDQARVIFIELLGLYEQKYGKHGAELLPLLTDITALNTQLKDDVDADEAKGYAVRRYKLYLRHHSDEFVEQFADQELTTTIHAKNTVAKLERHFDKTFDIYESDHWSIIYPPNKLKFVENKMAKLMERTYNNNISFLVSLGLRNKPIDEKMTAVYFATRDDYRSYINSITGDAYVAKASGGMYFPKARAMFVFGYDNKKQGKKKRPKAHTVAHEASHQVLYKTGFHSIHYVQPRWLKEGAAVGFEYHKLKKPFGPHTDNYAFRRVLPIKKALKNGSLISLADLVTFDGDDEDFESSMNQSDIYALGSMLVRFLYTYYPDEFKSYLTILSKSRTTVYERAKFGKNVRLKQFKKAFGSPEAMQEQFSGFIEQVIKKADLDYVKYKADKEAKKKAKREGKNAKNTD